MKSHTTQHGFAMMEVLVTAIVMAIGISGMGILLVKAIQGTQDSSQQSQAMWIVQDLVGKMRANPDGARDGNYVFEGNVACDNLPVMCSTTNVDGSIVNAADCQPDQMAAYDIWASVCSISENTYDSPADFIANPAITSRCKQQHPARGCILYHVELSWTTKIKQGGEAVNRDYKNTYEMYVEVN